MRNVGPGMDPLVKRLVEATESPQRASNENYLTRASSPPFGGAFLWILFLVLFYFILDEPLLLCEVLIVNIRGIDSHLRGIDSGNTRD